MTAPRAYRATPEQRRAAARKAALTRWARTVDRAAATAPARAAFLAQFEEQPHPTTALAAHMADLTVRRLKKRPAVTA